MNKKFITNLSEKKKLEKILNEMIPGDKYMPCFTKAVKIDKILIKSNIKKSISYLIKNNFEKKKFSEKLILVLGNEIIDIYFTSNIVIKALENRSKNYLKYKKKESLFTLLKKVKNTKLKFIK